MGLNANVKGISAIALILLIVISAVIGGIISYAFTIAYYAKIPEKTTLAITNININPENVRSFNVTVLNPSYSPGDANITRIALSLKNGNQLYEVVETNPSIKNGLAIRKSESINITCLSVKKDTTTITFGEFVSLFAGETILVHVFVEKLSAANMEVKLPFVKLDIDAEFNSRISFKKFNITLTNSPQSEINLTITDILIPGITIKEVKPNFRSQPVDVLINESVCFEFNGSWHGFTRASLAIYTQQGYILRKEIEMKKVYAVIQAVSFDEDQTSQFNVIVHNFAESANSVNVKNIECTLENGSKLIFDCSLAEITPNTTRVFTLQWDWREYRGKNMTVMAYFAQDFATLEYRAQTPPPIIVKVLNIAEAFNLRDKERFNITILNHASSLETVNITKIVVKRTGEILFIADGIISPSDNKTFSCNFNWAKFLKDYGRNLTLTVYANSNQTLREYAFDFSFTLPVAELKITAINHLTMGETGYLNLTIKNMDYSVWNLTLSKIILVIQDLAEPLEYLFPKNHVIVSIGSETILLCPFDWQKYTGKSITLTVVTEELVKATTLYTIT
ncbi:MAG: hypothetical protein QXL54_01480 [Candidatus Bathyarchaeia archaeon]